jgi:hypothetical protein
MIDEYGEFDGMRIGRGNRSNRRKIYTVKAELGPPPLETSYLRPEL